MKRSITRTIWVRRQDGYFKFYKREPHQVKSGTFYGPIMKWVPEP